MPLLPLFHAPALPHAPRPKRRCRRLNSQARPATAVPLLLTARPRVSPAAIHAISAAYTTSNAAIHHGVCAHALGRAAADLLQSAREQVARLIHAPDTGVVFAPCEVAAVDALASSFCRALRRGGELIFSATEPDVSRRVWEMHAGRCGVAIRYVRPNVDTGEFEFDEIAPLLSSRTRLLSLPVVCELLGARTPLADVLDFVKSVNCPVLLRATHALRHGSVDADALRADFVIAGGEAIGAPQAAFWYGRNEILETLPPAYGGDLVLGEYAMETDLESTNWGDVPERFDVGMPSLASAAALGAAADAQSRIVADHFARRAEELGTVLCERLCACPSVTVYGHAADTRVPSVCFNVDGSDARRVAQELATREVFVEAGCHGARAAHEELFGVPASIRAVFDPALHTRVDADRFAQEVSEVVARLSP